MTTNAWRPVTVGVDGSPDSWAALRWAAREAARRRSGLRLVHGCVGIVPWAAFDSLLQQDRADGPGTVGAALLVAAAERVTTAYPDLTVERVYMVGAPGAVLAEQSRTASLIVVGGRGQGGLHGLVIGSVATDIAVHAHCPVVVVRREAPDPDGPIVVGLDGSTASTAALGFAFDIAAQWKRPLRALYAWNALPTRNLGPVTTWRVDPAEAAEEAARLLAEQLAGWSEKYPDVAVQRRPTHSLGATGTLIEESQKAGLVVVGSRGRSTATGVLLGSVSRALVRHAHGPVAVVHVPAGS